MILRQFIATLVSCCVVAALGFGGSACGDDSGVADTADTGSSADTGDVADVSDAVDTAVPGLEGPPGLAERGFVEARVIAHLHSAYSHDGCDDEGLDENGTPNWTCIRRMKAALCQENIAVAFMTDHPGNMRYQPFEDLLYLEEGAGDTALTDDGGLPFAASFACPDGQGGDDGRALLIPGFEGTHTMPLHLTKHLDDADYGISFETETPDEDLARLTSAVASAGGFVGIAHSEQDNIDWATIANHDVAAMEVYNFHANFLEVMDGAPLPVLKSLDPFLDSGPDAPHSDLLALSMLDIFPVDALTKWRRVTAERHITGFSGSDVHENVNLPAICGGSLCDVLAEEAPHLVEYLKVGGVMVLSDGERLDAYERIFRWVQNRVWYQPSVDTLGGIRDAFVAGRNIVVIEVLGNAEEVEFVATVPSPDGEPEIRDMGAQVTVAEGATLWARSPNSPTPGRIAPWTAAEAADPETGAKITASLWRTTADSSEVVLEWETLGTWQKLENLAPGSYHMEVVMTPLHLRPYLGDAGDFADKTFRWVETNAIRVLETD